jgi:hypothetical protein
MSTNHTNHTNASRLRSEPSARSVIIESRLRRRKVNPFVWFVCFVDNSEAA